MQNVVLQNDRCVSRAIALQSNLYCNSKTHKECLRLYLAVVRYAEHLRAYKITVCVKIAIGTRLRSVFGGVTRHLYLESSSNAKIWISDSRAIVRYLKRPHATCSFQDTSVSTHETTNRKVFSMCAWIRNSPMAFHIQKDWKTTLLHLPDLIFATEVE